MSIETLEEHLRAYGWEFQRADGSTLVTGFATESGLTFPVVIQQQPPWTRISIPAYASLPAPGRSEEVYEKVLMLQASLPRVRLWITPARKFAMGMDVYSEADELPYAEVEQALDLLGYAAEVALHIFADET